MKMIMRLEEAEELFPEECGLCREEIKKAERMGAKFVIVDLVDSRYHVVNVVRRDENGEWIEELRRIVLKYIEVCSPNFVGSLERVKEVMGDKIVEAFEELMEEDIL